MTDEEIKKLKEEINTWKEASSANSYKAFQLQEENKTLSKHILELQKDKGELVDEVKSLKAQIEKMKCCGNCKHSRTEYKHCRTDKHEKWEIKEK
jgi:predicted  nucleic acid-binding Zn-ribbon protein